MSVATIGGTPRAQDRAMSLDAVVAEILLGVKGRDWLRRNVPPECRWQGPPTRPPLFSEMRTRAWWEGRAA